MDSQRFIMRTSYLSVKYFEYLTDKFYINASKQMIYTVLCVGVDALGDPPLNIN